MIAPRHSLPGRPKIGELLKRAHEIVADPTVAPQQFVAAAGVLLAEHVLGCGDAYDGEVALATAALAIAALTLEDES